MLSRIRALVSRQAQSQHLDTALEKPKLSRQELTELFARELGRPMPSEKAPHARGVRRGVGTGQPFEFFRSRRFGLQSQQRGS